MFIPADPKHPLFTLVESEYTSKAGPFGPGQNKAQLVIDDDISKNRSSTVVWYDGGTDPVLSSLNDGQIYIRGHGMAGSPELEMARGGEQVHYAEVVQRLVTSGLKREFRGQIKCFNCHSAESGPHGNAVDGHDPFGQNVADELYKRGYKLCTVYGYTDAIDSYPTAAVKNAAEPGEVLHKYRRAGMAATDNLGRAKSGRVEFAPRVPPLTLKQRLAQKFF
ncbi:MAG: hypothetical protein HKO98_07220 [Gemmatimonadetes bacterium]|nr:hypothetical protein [Gemmatimonadota bacterium]